jgi:hypothetical protein
VRLGLPDGYHVEATSGKAELLDAAIIEDWDDIPLVTGAARLHISQHALRDQRKPEL